MKGVQTALANLKASLQRIRNLANDALANIGQAMKDPALRERHETALSAVVVTMTGYFESFLREVAEGYAETICQQNHPFGDLKPNIRHTHFQGGGKVLSNIGGRNRSAWYSWTNATALDVAKRLSSVDIGPPYDLVWEAFAETGGNPRSEVIREFLKRFGVLRPIETLAQNVHLPSTPPFPPVPLSPQALSTLLDNFITIRNECAHTGQPANAPPSANDVLDYCDLLENIAAGIVGTLTTHRVC